jgi:two-component system OmpR family sensor kinase
MDGFKKRLKASIQLRLSWALALAIVLVAVAAGAFSFVSAFDDAQELQDDLLYQIASLVKQRDVAFTGDSRLYRLEDRDHDSTVFVELLGPNASTVTAAGTATADPLPAALALGLHTVESKDGALRVLVTPLGNGDKAAVAQTTRARDEVALNNALRTLLPFFVLVPILLIVVAHLVRQMLRPITDLSEDVDRRSQNDLTALPEDGVPVEVRPFVGAINGLLARVAEAIRTQRRFIADAAHELRSPLTALSLQAERLEHSDMSAPARARLHDLRGGIERNRALLGQLLSLSRAEHRADPTGGPVPVQRVFRRVLEDLLPLAKAKRIDLGVTDAGDVNVGVGELDLTTLVKNLVDNAIRYTPAGGRVDLSALATADGAALRVADTGPGIPVSERERVFDPFYRILGSEQFGSGLGLSIVKTITDRLGARVELEYTDPARHAGLSVTVTFPSPTPARHD